MCNSTHAVLAFTLCYIGVLWVMVWLSAMLLITDELGKFPASPHAAMPAFTPSPTFGHPNEVPAYLWFKAGHKNVGTCGQLLHALHKHVC
jgi:hypothetical protein